MNSSLPIHILVYVASCSEKIPNDIGRHVVATRSNNVAPHKVTIILVGQIDTSYLETKYS